MNVVRPVTVSSPQRVYFRRRQRHGVFFVVLLRHSYSLFTNGKETEGRVLLCIIFGYPSRVPTKKKSGAHTEIKLVDNINNYRTYIKITRRIPGIGEGGGGGGGATTTTLSIVCVELYLFFTLRHIITVLTTKRVLSSFAKNTG